MIGSNIACLRLYTTFKVRVAEVQKKQIMHHINRLFYVTAREHGEQVGIQGDITQGTD